jgi:hypothetical protein
MFDQPLSPLFINHDRLETRHRPLAMRTAEDAGGLFDLIQSPAKQHASLSMLGRAIRPFKPLGLVEEIRVIDYDDFLHTTGPATPATGGRRPLPFVEGRFAVVAVLVVDHHGERRAVRVAAVCGGGPFQPL